ncbi:Ubiquitin domain-containing protein 1 [Monoraphidium neglectum]|uniref:Ubiquitin domain-containing protein 1 n=1 Tax=Monoraphidium neglectum TaxID=145388 RepID=A0A0D2MIB1_9CHLO|nr:Ubiquitin domain-containing protein 1 [Monoraphidium neglectum]KIY94710.1 Ubiquitin domain-containing protein 1 [Monoraphidium neglectum]|eukprot:XP_013893730.1 Ubiquitin domain-containing protein 1 [Monoraphidium neglectum]
MGCFQSKEDAAGAAPRPAAASKEREVAQLKKLVWRSEEPLDAAALQRKREEFWDTQPYYGGSREIWDALKAACASDPEMAKVLLDAAEVKVMKADMSVSYDARGFRYELPPFVLADPSNLTA